MKTLRFRTLRRGRVYPQGDLPRDLPLFKGYHLEQYGIFLDGSNYRPPYHKSIIAIGDTSITYNASGLALYCVTLLRSKATITASDWAVVKVESDPT